MKIGIDIGGSHINIGLIDEQYKILIKCEHNWTQEEKENFYNAIIDYCTIKIGEIMKNNKDIKYIGIGYPSKNIIDGIIIDKGKKIDIPKILNEKFEVPVFLRNDVKCSGLCEKRIGNLKEYTNCFFMTLGTGIGGAYFYKDELVIPTKHSGFEIGHMIIEKNGVICKCGKYGCFEKYASMNVFRKKIMELFNLEKMNSDIFYNVLKQNKKIDEVNKIINEYLDYLAIGIVNIIEIFEPEAICIGGSFVYYEETFMEGLKSNIKNMLKNRDIPPILLAKYKNDAGIIGATII